jgi:hypothetical protein
MSSVIQIGEIGADLDAQLVSVNGRPGDEGMRNPEADFATQGLRTARSGGGRTRFGLKLQRALRKECFGRLDARNDGD